jgi:hypothetical protein
MKGLLSRLALKKDQTPSTNSVRNFSRTVRKEMLGNIINEILKERNRIGGIDLPFLFFYLMSKASIVVFNVALRIISSAKGD